MPEKSAGQELKALRKQRGLSIRDVYKFSKQVAVRRRNPAFLLPPSRLSDIERKGVTPSIYRLYTLSLVYKCGLRKLLRFYGIK